MARVPHNTETEHLAECASEARSQAALLPHGKVRDALLARAEQHETRLQRHSAGDDNDHYPEMLPNSR